MNDFRNFEKKDIEFEEEIHPDFKNPDEISCESENEKAMELSKLLLADQQKEVDEGAPVLVKKIGGSTSLSHNDVEQELLDIEEGMTNLEEFYVETGQSVYNELMENQNNSALSSAEKSDLLKEGKVKIENIKRMWLAEQADLLEEKEDLLRNSPTEWDDDQLEVEESLQDNADVLTVDEAPDVESLLDKADTLSEGKEINEWLGDVNPNFDAYDVDSPYSNNCGSCALTVMKHLNGDVGEEASSENIGTIEEMNEITQMEQVSMSPENIEQNLLEVGDGAHAIIGIDRAEGPGHWFNASNVNGKIVAIDGQTGEISDWPPDYGNVTNWDMSMKKER